MFELKNKQVLVIGFGRQGKALAKWLPKQGAKVIVNDKRTAGEIGLKAYSEFPGVRFVLGNHPPDVLQDTDVICLSGGVPLQLPVVQLAMAKGIPITNDAQLFMERCP